MKRIALLGMPNTGKSTLFNRISGASALVQASMNGDMPVRFNIPLPDLPLLSRTFTSAPCAASCFTNCRLLRLPEPIGEGSPSSSSPRAGLRTQTTVCSAVKPER